METYSNALDFAIKAHHGQTRKSSSTSSVVHPIRVATKILLETRDMTLATAALLHDTLEDTSVSYSDLKTHFGAEIADLVWEVTDDLALKSRLSRTDFWLTTWKAMSTGAKIIRFYDRLDNIRDRPSKKYVLRTLTVLGKLDSRYYPSTVLNAYNQLVTECKMQLIDNEW